MVELNAAQKEALNSDAAEEVITAPPGSGKTEILRQAIIQYRHNHPTEVIDAITYTRAATAELRDRLAEQHVLDVNISTIHVWARERLKELAVLYKFEVKVLEQEDIMLILRQLIEKAHATKVKPEILYSYVTGNKKMDVSEGYAQTLDYLDRMYIAYKRNNELYDFTDYPLYLLTMLKKYNEKIVNTDALFVDELQDVDDEQRQLFELVCARKKFYIGDAWQCQPAGTLIRLANRTIKKIENIEIGDRLVSYSHENGGITGCGPMAKGYPVTQKQEFLYSNDYLITITTESGKKSSYTANHLAVVNFDLNTEYNEITYLECDDNGNFRVGTSQLYNKEVSACCFKKRMIDENCTKQWILAAFKTNLEARREEDRVTCKYGIPQNIFNPKNCVMYSLDDIKYILGGVDLVKRGKECLKDYKLDYDYPLNYKGNKNHFSRDAATTIYAININPKLMKVRVHNPNGIVNRVNHGKENNNFNNVQESIISCEKTFITEPIKVYCLNVEPYHYYVADDILTHNCIYAFRGADGDIFDSLDDFKRYKLTVNYRSFQEILDYADTFYVQLRERIGQRGLKVSDIDYRLPSDTICDRGKGGIVYLTDFWGETKIIGQAKIDNDQPNFFNEDDYNKKPQNTPIDTYSAGCDILSGHYFILCRTNKQVKAIQDLGYSNVSTVHQAKGLEYDNVLMVDIEAKDNEDLNIAYVAATRARNKLMVMNYNMMYRLLVLYRDKAGQLI
jgi:hypothetical protein